MKNQRLIEKIKRGIPVKKANCDRCPLGAACCGCPAQREYDRYIKQLKEDGIFEFAVEYQKYIDNKKRIKKMQRENKIIEERFNRKGLGEILY